MDKNKTVLLVVDVQNALIWAHPYNERKVIENIKRLISVSKAYGIEVVYVRHHDQVGGELVIQTDGWQIYSEIAPNRAEKVFDKQFNSAFLHTGLKEYLDRKKISSLILVGLQTEYCIDATCKTAFEYGYTVIIPEETNTTFDNEFLSGERLYQFYNHKIWNKRFANLMTVDDVVKYLIGGK